MRYIGCFNEPVSCPGPNTGRALELLGSSSSMTIELCAGMASARGFTYSAVQSHQQCFGGNDVSRYSLPGTCNLPCSGNTSQICGGDCANSIYDVSGKLKRSKGLHRCQDW
jgi:hypothetical protein